MADNLTISIGADTSKFHAGLAIAEQKLKQFGRQVNAAARDVAKGVGDPARVEQLSAAYQKQAGVVRQLRKEYDGVALAADGATRSLRNVISQGSGIRRIASQFGGVGSGIENIAALLGQMAGGFVGAFAGVAVVKGIQTLFTNLDDLSKKLSEIQKQARDAGVGALAIQAIGEAARKTGQDAQVGVTALTKFSAALDAARKAEPAPDTRGVQLLRGDETKAVSRDVVTMRGSARDTQQSVVTEMRGSAQATRDFSDALDALNVAFKKFPDTPEGKLQAFAFAIKRALELEKQFPSQINRLSQELFGAPIANIRAIAGDAQKLDALIKDLAQTQRAATADALSDNDKLIAAKNKVGTAFQELTAGYSKWLIAFQTTNNEWLASFIGTTLPAWSAGISQVFADLKTSVVASWQATMDLFKGIDDKMFADLLAGWDGFWQSVAQFASNTLDWITQKATAVANAVRGGLSAITGGAPAGVPAMPMARGGHVRGAGSGTSDSILARLSNGEFVMRASAVQHWGAGMLSAMNSAGMPRFADGGLVAAGAGGTPVHLHLGGHSFALAGAGSVVDALVVEAHRQHIRSAGVKPSWYGGRPGGR